MGCSKEPQPINYGSDACHFCKMNIVDPQHAAEIVTKKGKVFKYDAIECMLNDTKNDQNTIALYLVMDYNQPDNFINATTASYLISKAIPSPMNAYLSAFKTDDEAIEAKQKHTGSVYTWDGIKLQKFNLESANSVTENGF